MEIERNSNVAVPKRRGRTVLFSLLLLAIVIAAIVRSAVTTGLDSFTYDEAYHVGAGAAYVQTGDFRKNPEQPPRTKLWSIRSRGR